MARVLVFYQYYCTPSGSWSTRYYEFCRRWVSAGHDVTVITSIYDKSDLKPDGLVTRFDIDGSKVVAVNLTLSNKDGVLRRLWTFSVYAVLSCWYSLAIRADVVVASSGPITVGIPGLLAKWLRRVPLIFEVRDLWPEGAIQLGLLRSALFMRLARWFERMIYRNSDVVVALSPGMAEGVLAAVPRARVVTIPNSADLDLFSPSLARPKSMAGSLTEKFLVLYAGTLGRANSTTEIVDLAAEVQSRGEEDIRFVVIGDGFERAAMEQLGRDRGLRNIVFLGVLPKTEVAAWHAAAAVTLCAFKPVPVLDTCSPNKLFDSLAAGRPVVNNTAGWIRDLLERSGAGVSYRAGNVEVAADHIVALCRDPSRRRRMGVRARELAEAEFSRDMLAARFADLFPREGLRQDSEARGS